MDITDNREKSAETFEEADSGEVFEHEGDFYMKLTSNHTIYNAVDLGDGVLICFSDDEPIKPIYSAELILGD